MILNQQHEVRVAMRPLESFLRRVKRELGLKQSEMTVCLISDKTMTRLNQKFRKKKGPTDVLSFPQENSFSPLVNPELRGATRLPRTEKGASRGASKGAKSKGHFLLLSRRSDVKTCKRSDDQSPPYLGDIAISPATARRYASEPDRTLASELRVLILHGVLHLLGYDHETDHGEMDEIEQRLRKRFGLT